MEDLQVLIFIDNCGLSLLTKLNCWLLNVILTFWKVAVVLGTIKWLSYVFNELVTILNVYSIWDLQFSHQRNWVSPECHIGNGNRCSDVVFSVRCHTIALISRLDPLKFFTNIACCSLHQFKLKLLLGPTILSLVPYKAACIQFLFLWIALYIQVPRFFPAQSIAPVSSHVGAFWEILPIIFPPHILDTWHDHFVLTSVEKWFLNWIHSHIPLSPASPLDTEDNPFKMCFHGSWFAERHSSERLGPFSILLSMFYHFLSRSSGLATICGPRCALTVARLRWRNPIHQEGIFH